MPFFFFFFSSPTSENGTTTDRNRVSPLLLYRRDTATALSRSLAPSFFLSYCCFDPRRNATIQKEEKKNKYTLKIVQQRRGQRHLTAAAQCESRCRPGETYGGSLLFLAVRNTRWPFFFFLLQYRSANNTNEPQRSRGNV